MYIVYIVNKNKNHQNSIILKDPDHRLDSLTRVTYPMKS